MENNNQSPDEIAQEIARLRSIPLEESVKKKFYEEMFDVTFPALKNRTLSVELGSLFADIVLELENIDNYGDFLAYQTALGICSNGWEFIKPILERYAEQTTETLKLKHGFSSETLLRAALSPVFMALNHKILDKFNKLSQPTQVTGIVYCTQCGAQNPEGSRFCFKCGKPLEYPTSNGESH